MRRPPPPTCHRKRSSRTSAGRRANVTRPKEKIRMVPDGLRGEHSIAEHQRWVPRLRSSLNNGHFST